MPYEFHTSRRIEFSDTDMAGIVQFSRFFIFMQSTEHLFMRSLVGTPFIVVDDRRIAWPRLKASCEYLRPVKFEEVLNIHLRVVKKGAKSLTYQFEFSRDDEVIARGRVSVACCIPDPVKGFTAIAIPPTIADQIQIAPEWSSDH